MTEKINTENYEEAIERAKKMWAKAIIERLKQEQEMKLKKKKEELEIILDEVLETSILVIEAAIEGVLHHENLAALNDDLYVKLRRQKDYLNDMKNEIQGDV